MKDMSENHDAEDPAFEDRIRGLLAGDVASRGVSVAAVTAGARRRRVRRRITAAGSSVAVLGVAAGVVAFSLPSAGPGAGRTEAGGTVTSPVDTITAPTTTPTTAPTTPTTPTTARSTAAPAKTCSASVAGSLPGAAPVTADGLDFEEISGTTAGIPWSVQVHGFPDWQSWLEWRKTQANPPVPPTASHVLGPPALIRASGRPQFAMMAVPHYSFVFAGDLVGGGAAGGPRTYLLETWALPTVDHLCVQFARRAEYEPVHQIQGGAFAAFGYTAGDEPQRVTGYDKAGQVVGTAVGMAGMLPPDGK